MTKKQILKLIAVLGLIALLMVALSGCTPAEEPGPGENGDLPEEAEPVTLNLSVAASLTDAMEEIAGLYKDEAPHVTIEYNFSSSGALQQQIEQGAPVDIFISAAPKQMNELEEGDLLLEGTRIDLLQNELVLVVPKGSTIVSDFADLTKDEVKLIAIGDPESVPAGKYAQETFTTLEIWEQVEKKLMMGKDVREVLAYVETEAVEAGAVYRTDAGISDKVDIVAAAPEGAHAPLIYPLAVIKDSANPEAARAFIEYLTGTAAKAVLEKYGFKPF